MARHLLAADPLRSAVEAIEASRQRIAVVLDPDGVLLGTLTDGDVRRCLLSGGSLTTPVDQAMNPRPITADQHAPSDYVIDLMKRGNVLAIPLVDSRRRFVRVAHMADLRPERTSAESGFEFAVIMAGGEGMRLRPLTENIPKPMIEVGGVPLIERQVRSLADRGLKTVFIAVNYLSQVIEQHFGDGSALGVRVEYLREDRKLGTAGALTLLPRLPEGPIVVMNGDILTTADLSSLCAFHASHEACVTLAAIDYRVNIPYGVVQCDGASVRGIVEKPSQQFLCNAGIYALSPRALTLLPRDEACNMTDLITRALEKGERVSVFPMHEYWNDIGTPDDLERARAFFNPSST